MQYEEKNIPEQHEGRKVDIISKAGLPTVDEAKVLFKTASERLVNISHWTEIAEGPSSKFTLTDHLGNEVDRPAQTGDHFKIKIPAPGSGTGEGYDWVHIENIHRVTDTVIDVELVSILVRPSSNPQNDKKDTAHFFDPETTSTFLVKREKNIVTAEMHGRNETPNLHPGGVLDTFRHIVVALSAMVGFSNPQWQHLTDGMISQKDKSNT